MQERIRKGVRVEINFADLPVSMVGTILHVDSQALVVSLAPDEDPARPAAPSTPAGNVQVSATTEDALYRFTSTLLRSSGLLLYLSPPLEIRRLQRRENVRQPCLLDLEFIAPRGDRAREKREQATAINISCGGLLIVYGGQLEVGEAVELLMKFPHGEPPLQAVARVIRTEHFSSPGQDLRSRVALRVVGLQRADEKRLTQFITKLQVKSVRGALRTT